MDILTKDKSFILSEACLNDDRYVYAESADEYVDDLEHELNFIRELDEDIEYAPQMVNVIAFDEAYGEQSYVVEYDNLIKLMESANCDEYDAVKMIAECNNISMDDISILIESEESILEKMEEIGAKGGKMFKKDAKGNATKKLKDIKSKGLNLAKKKNKKKPSSKKKKGKHIKKHYEYEFDFDVDLELGGEKSKRKKRK